MANTFKSFTSGSIGTTLVNLYTCPASTTTIVLGASIANTHTNPIGGSIKLAKSGSILDDVFIVKQAPVPVGSTVEVMSGNIHSNPIGGSIKLAKNGGDDVFIVKQAPVPVGSTVEVMSGNKVVLESADILQFQSDTAGSMDTIVSLLEIS